MVHIPAVPLRRFTQIFTLALSCEMVSPPPTPHPRPQSDQDVKQKSSGEVSLTAVRKSSCVFFPGADYPRIRRANFPLAPRVCQIQFDFVTSASQQRQIPPYSCPVGVKETALRESSCFNNSSHSLSSDSKHGDAFGMAGGGVEVDYCTEL